MKALLVVDVQNDFCPGGALAVDEGDQVVPVINKLIPEFPLVVASMDWHPEGSDHFKKWPPHCIRQTKGADLHKDLHLSMIEKIFLKGTEDKDDGYSAFEATNMNLEEFLKGRGVTDLYIAGLTTDYCVKETVLDAINKGFNTYMFTDATRAVNANPGDGQKALDEMAAAGACLIKSTDYAKPKKGCSCCCS
jgi:nicotinamidase/pyrazinamidase